MTNAVTTYLKYANLQMAAESLFGITPSDVPGTVKAAGSMNQDSLTLGNNRASRFTTVLANRFLDDGWTVIEHKSNTSTGFSGTLFKNANTNELVLSFRSTEFADDAARDNEATNKLEVKEAGWAFGQIADMEDWYAQLNADPSKLGGKSFAVTGYSLGGHLATAFNLLHQGEGRISETYTFNSAGVGTVNTGTTLRAVIDAFRQQRDNASLLETNFTTAIALDQYRSSRTIVNGTATSTQIAAAISSAYNAKSSPTAGAQAIQELDLLISALEGAVRVTVEVERLGSVTDSSAAGGPKSVGAAQIAATRVDYQLAARVAQRSTASFRTGLQESLDDLRKGARAQAGPIANFYDVVGAVPPSAVSNSQYHWGRVTPIYIEDQPLWRGTVAQDVVTQSLWFSGSKLLVPEFSKNDFGDTHSLVLLVDSLSIQDTLAKLDPSVTPATLDMILTSASNQKALSGGGPIPQGKAEGDVLENVLNSLSRIFVGPNAPKTEGKLDGGTWAIWDDRNAFYNNLQALQNSTAFKDILGKVSLSPTAGKTTLPIDARIDFASFLSLLNLSPFVLKAKSDADAIVVEALLAANWGSLRTEWLTDKNAIASGQAAENYTDAYLYDRQTMLQWQMVRNLTNVATGDPFLGQTTNEIVNYDDNATNLRVQLRPTAPAPAGTYPTRYITFGSEAAETITGASRDDHLYGGAGDDTLNGQGGDDYLEGGSGSDTYVVGANSGIDTIVDSNHAGTIKLGGRTLSGGGKLLSDGAQRTEWIDSSDPAQPIVYVLDKTSKVLLIRGYGSGVMVKNFSGGDLGIAVPSAPATWATEKVGGAGADIMVGSYVDGRPGDPVVVPPDEHAFRPRTEAVANDKLVGGLGNDELSGYMGDDWLEGNEGNDLFQPGFGNDVVLGGIGDDVVLPDEITSANAGYQWTDTSQPPQAAGSGYNYLGYTFVLTGAGNAWALFPNNEVAVSAGMFFPEEIDGTQASDDYVDVGDGADLVFAGWGQDTVWLGTGNDVAFGQGGMDVIYGEAGADLIYGDGDLQFISDHPYLVSYADIALHGNDIIDGGGDNDTIYAGGGSDVVYGGAGDDIISADGQHFSSAALNIPVAYQGDDYVDAGDGSDSVYGFGGSDTLLGGKGNDFLFGDYAALVANDQKADYLDGGEGDDQLYGQGGDDTLLGGVGGDQLYGGNGADLLVGGAGWNTLKGEDGQDVLAASGENDTLEGGAGRDTLRISAGANVTIKAERNAEADADELVFEVGLSAAQVKLELNRTYDPLTQVATITFAGSTTTVKFSSPPPIIAAAAASPAFASLSLAESDAAAMDAVNATNAAAAAEPNLASVLTSITFADGISWSQAEVRDHLRGIATEGNDELWALNGENDSLAGLGGNDTFYGGNGNDSFYGGDGNDGMNGQHGDDTLDGGDGADEMFGAEGSDSYWGGAGNDAMRDSSATSNDTYRYDLGGGADIIDDMGGTDRLDLGQGIAQGDVRVLLQGGGIQLLLPDSGWVAIGSTLATGAIDLQRFVEVVRFADGSEWDIARIKQELLESTAARDFLYGFETDDVIDGGDGDDVIEGMDGNDTLYGGNGNDTLWDQSGDDTMYGGAGDDGLLGGAGNDTLIGGAGSDSLQGGDGNDIYRFNAGDGADTVNTFGTGADTIEVGSGIASSAASLQRVDSNLVVSFGGADSITLTGMFDALGAMFQTLESIRFNDGTIWTTADIEAELLRQASTGTNGDDVRYLSENADTFDALDGNDTVYGLGGNDTLDGGNGNDTLYGSFGNDTLQGGAGNDTLEGEDQDDVLLGGDGADTLNGGYGNDTFDGGAGNDNLSGLSGNEIYLFGKGDGQDTIGRDYGGSLSSVLRFKTGVASAEVVVKQVLDTFWGGMSALEVSIAGTADKVTISKYFNVTYPTVQRIEFSDGTVWDAARISQEVAANLPRTLIGTDQADTLTGAGGNDTLDGREGVDTLIGKAGDDTYWIEDDLDAGYGGYGGHSGDIIVENLNDGNDLVLSYVNWILGDNLENLTLTGTAAIDGTGNALNNVLTGNDAANLLDGGAGADNMAGGAGNDVYVTDNAGDVVTEGASAGTDIVRSSVTWTLGNNVENLVLTGAAAVNGTGNSLDNELLGNSASNTLTGGSGNDRLDGGAGTDTMVGGTGNDTYIVDNAADVVTEASSAGTDAVESGVSFTLGSNVENLTLTGAAAINAIGNSLANVLTGNSAANTLNGSTGADTLAGGGGDDTYVVDNTADVVTEAAGAGTDTVQSSVAWSLGSTLENLTLTGSGTINGTGNSLDNVLTGNGANNTLNGGAGNDTIDGGSGTDTMVGGTGNDTYVVNTSADVVTENAGEGTDTVRTTASLTLGSNLENLTLIGTSAINATGNTLNNVLTGNSANNTLNGGAGNDTMLGGAGNDTYVVDVSTDVVTENAGEGTDTVQSGITWTLAANVENLTLTASTAVNGTGNTLDNVLTGNSANNTLTGGAGNDTLNGGSGNDTMVGGTGNDAYVVNVSTDVVTELAGEGTDTVQSSVTLTLGSNLENLTLTGSSTINGTGNTLDNVLTGNSANNTLTAGAGNDTIDGGTGNDTMVGGAGNDSYVVNVTTDVVTEAANEGTDTVQSAVTWTLGNNLENLTLTGTSAINATGNTLNNVLTGNSGANVLTGAAGDDSYDGAAGNDTFTDTSTTSNDTYRWGIGSGLDTLTDSGGSLDHVDLFAGVAKSDLRFAQSGNHLQLTVSGQADMLTLNNWFAGSANQVEEFRLADGSKVLASEVQSLLGAMAVFSAGSSGAASTGRMTAMPIRQFTDITATSLM